MISRLRGRNAVIQPRAGEVAFRLHAIVLVPVRLAPPDDRQRLARGNDVRGLLSVDDPVDPAVRALLRFVDPGELPPVESDRGLGRRKRLLEQRCLHGM